MKKTLFTLTTCAMILASSSAFAGYGHEGKTYTNIGLGYGVQDHNQEITGGSTASLKDMGDGLLGNLGMGYYLLDEFRVDFNIHYDRGFKSKKSNGTVTARGKEVSVGLFGNAYYDLLNNSNVTPYVMLGAGFLRNEYKTEITVSPNMGRENKSQYSIAYQAGMGLAYHAGSNVDIDFGYRYINKGSDEYKMTIISPAVNVKAAPDIVHAAIIGLRLTY